MRFSEASDNRNARPKAYCSSRQEDLDQPLPPDHQRLKKADQKHQAGWDAEENACECGPPLLRRERSPGGEESRQPYNENEPAPRKEAHIGPSGTCSNHCFRPGCDVPALPGIWPGLRPPAERVSRELQRQDSRRAQFRPYHLPSPTFRIIRGAPRGPCAGQAISRRCCSQESGTRHQGRLTSSRSRQLPARL